jgi:predicted Ser/Thr protein kinase
VGDIAAIALDSCQSGSDAVAEKIGKYEVVERIGRGGMGVIFSARDPMLNRPVALKVISALEVTAELRSRFFREAQACARLSHPNIVTVYDMGEDDGRLFIVMELLEGEDLRQLIGRRAPLAVEEMLPIMQQVCDGLHYAHQKGIVHRDVKPANIMLLRTGQVKILDFGIARVAAADADLTRTGMIMGTLRYVAPEQVRGRADHRSDIFSVGAVFYELLSSRPAFMGEDPIEILEQLRTGTPRPLCEIDPELPPELAAIVEQAMRKDPLLRFADLQQMRIQLGQAQRARAEEAGRVRARVRTQRGELEALESALAAEIGPLGPRDPLDGDADRQWLATLQVLEREIAHRIETARAQRALAETLAPALRRGRRLLEAGQFESAIPEFEAIVTELPAHAHAAEGLAQAREMAEQSRRRQLATRLAMEARSALDGGAHARCLELLKQAGDGFNDAEAGAEMTALRQRAEAALAAEEADRRAREQAGSARDRMEQARRTAEGYAAAYPDARQDGLAQWNAAEEIRASGEMAFTGGAYAEAQPRFERAATLYREAEHAAHDARLTRELAHADAERARETATRARRAAVAPDTIRYAPEQTIGREPPVSRALTAAEPSAEGVDSRAVVADPPLVRVEEEGLGGAIIEATASSPRRPRLTGDWQHATRPAGWRWVQWARGLLVGAGAVVAIVLATLYWSTTPKLLRSPEQPPAPAAPMRDSPEHQAIQEWHHHVSVAREEAAGAQAERLSAGQFAAAVEKARAGDLAREQQDLPTAELRYREAIEAFGVARAEANRSVLPPRSESAARGVEKGASASALASTGQGGPIPSPKRDPDKSVQGGASTTTRKDAEQARARMSAARRAAEQAAAGFFARTLFASAQAKERDGIRALEQSDDESAIRWLNDAQSLYQTAALEARREADAERQLAPVKAALEESRATVAASRQQALKAEAEQLAKGVFAAAQARHVQADGLVDRRDLAAAVQAYQDAAEGYRQAMLRAQSAREGK